MIPILLWQASWERFSKASELGFLWLEHQLLALFRQRQDDKLEQVPIQPLNVWLSWSVAFASQGLGHWIRDFSAGEDPRNHSGYGDMTAKERFHERAQLFASELLTSAWFQLWPQVFPCRDSVNPLHWNVRGVESIMADLSKANSLNET